MGFIIYPQLELFIIETYRLKHFLQFSWFIMAEQGLPRRAVIEEASMKVQNSPELRNDDWLLFHTVLEAFDEVCDAVAVGEATRQHACQARTDADEF